MRCPFCGVERVDVGGWVGGVGRGQREAGEIRFEEVGEEGVERGCVGGDWVGGGGGRDGCKVAAFAVGEGEGCEEGEDEEQPEGGHHEKECHGRGARGWDMRCCPRPRSRVRNARRRATHKPVAQRSHVDNTRLRQNPSSRVERR